MRLKNYNITELQKSHEVGIDLGLLKKSLLKTSKIILTCSNSLARQFSSMFHAKCLLPRLSNMATMAVMAAWLTLQLWQHGSYASIASTAALPVQQHCQYSSIASTAVALQAWQH